MFVLLLDKVSTIVDNASTVFVDDIVVLRVTPRNIIVFVIVDEVNTIVDNTSTVFLDCR